MTPTKGIFVSLRAVMVNNFYFIEVTSYEDHHVIIQKELDLSFCTHICLSRAKTELIYSPNWQLREQVHIYFRLDSNDRGRMWRWRWRDARESKVEDQSAPVVPDTDGQDERGTQAQLRPCSMECYKTRNQWSQLCTDDTGFTATQSLAALTRNPGDATSTVASRLKALSPSKIKSSATPKVSLV